MELDFIDKNHYRLYPLDGTNLKNSTSTKAKEALCNLFTQAAFNVFVCDYTQITETDPFTIKNQNLTYPTIFLDTILSDSRNEENVKIYMYLADFDGSKKIATFSITIPKNITKDTRININKTDIEQQDNVYCLVGGNEILSGYIITGIIDESSVNNILNNINDFTNIPFCRTTITWFKGNYPNTIQFINKNRNRVIRENAYPDQANNEYWTTMSLLAGLQNTYDKLSSVFSKGTINLNPGFNCNITSDIDTNTITITPNIGDGAGTANREIPLGYYYKKTDLNDGSYFLETCLLNSTKQAKNGIHYFLNGIKDQNVVKSINGTTASDIKLELSGISCDQDQTTSTINIKLNPAAKNACNMVN